MRYEVVRQDDPVLRERLKELAKVRRRFGYRRLHVFLRREGHEVNHKRLFRIYREEQLHVRRRGGRKRAMGTRAPMVLPLLPNQRWSLDFVSDQLTDGRPSRRMLHSPAGNPISSAPAPVAQPAQMGRVSNPETRSRRKKAAGNVTLDERPTMH